MHKSNKNLTKMRKMHLWLIFCMTLTIVACHSTEDCLQAHNLTHAELNTLLPSTEVVSIPKQIKCYAKCLLKDYISGDNKLDLQLIGDKANVQEKTIISQCMAQYDNISGSEPCGYAYLLLQCLALKAKGNQSS